MNRTFSILFDETELRAFFLVANTALSLFILCLFVLEGEKRGKGRVIATKNARSFFS